MEENKTTRVNRTVNYYSDRPDYDSHMEKHNCHCERPHYDYCPEKPEYDRYPERPHYDYCPERPEYNHHPVRPNHDHYPVRPEYDHHPVRPNHDYCEENPKYDCCEDKHDHCHEKQTCCCCPETNLKPNECCQCCKPLALKCPDISCAVCTPILTDRVFDFKCISQKLSRVVPTAEFVVDPPPMGVTYTPGAEVCIEKIAVNYTCLGFTDGTLDVVVDTVGTTTLPDTGSLSCSAATPLYNNYSGPIISSALCCDRGRNVSLIQTPGTATAQIVNSQYIVKGFIGCEPFTARFPATPGSEAFTPPFPAINLFTNICLPETDESVTLTAKFDLKLLAKCIRPLGTFEAGTAPAIGTFNARIFDELLVNEKLYVTTPDLLAVFSSPDVFKHNEK